MPLGSCPNFSAGSISDVGTPTLSKTWTPSGDTATLVLTAAAPSDCAGGSDDGGGTGRYRIKVPRCGSINVSVTATNDPYSDAESLSVSVVGRAGLEMSMKTASGGVACDPPVAMVLSGGSNPVDITVKCGDLLEVWYNVGPDSAGVATFTFDAS